MSSGFTGPTPAIVRARALVTRWGQPTPFFIQTLTEHTLFTNSEQSRQGPSHTKFTSQGPPPSRYSSPLPWAGGGRSLVPKGQGGSRAPTSRNNTLLEMATLNG